MAGPALAILASGAAPAPPADVATSGQPVRDAAAWSFEVKCDGWRVLAYIDDGLKVRTRSGRQMSDSLPQLAGLVDGLVGRPGR
jgi:bifunctional non-homologous end joining protein LigD